MRNIALDKQLCDAIKKHRVIRLQYKSQNYHRTFEPYLIYRSTKDKILLGCTQTLDDSQPLKVPEPHNFETELISTLKVTGKTFTYDEKFDPAAKSIATAFSASSSGKRHLIKSLIRLSQICFALSRNSPNYERDITREMIEKFKPSRSNTVSARSAWRWKEWSRWTTSSWRLASSSRCGASS